MSIRIVIGCHSYLLSEGIKNLLKAEKDFEVTGIFDEGSDIGEILKLQPDVVLVDNKMFRSFPMESINNKAKFLLISDSSWTQESEKGIPDLVLKGVYGLLASDSDSRALIDAVKVVHSGELWLDRNIIKNIITQISKAEKPVDLTRKEKEIVTLICRGYRNKEIAQKLDISEQTVKSHCNRIYKKMGVTDRLQLALYTHRISPDRY